MVAAYFAPLWWVSLTAPNYPEDAFPDGIRIHFHFDGVKNGCSTPPRNRLAAETVAEDMGEGTGRFNPILAEQTTLTGKATALDCVHEMNTINHYVGMYPIATGGPVETKLSKFFVTFFAVMLLTFAVRRRKQPGHHGRRLRRPGRLDDRGPVRHGQPRRPRQALHGRVRDLLQRPRTHRRLGQGVEVISKVAIFGMIAAMGVVIFGVLKLRNFELLLALIPGLLPLFYPDRIFGLAVVLRPRPAPLGRLHGQEPFMPTVFGEGKVAQFSTYSLPHWATAC